MIKAGSLAALQPSFVWHRCPRMQIYSSQEQYDLDDPLETPAQGECLRDFFDRTRAHWIEKVSTAGTGRVAVSFIRLQSLCRRMPLKALWQVLAMVNSSLESLKPEEIHSTLNSAEPPIKTTIQSDWSSGNCKPSCMPCCGGVPVPQGT